MNKVNLHNKQNIVNIKILTIVTILVSIDFWSYIYMPNIMWQVQLILAFLFIAILVISQKKYKDSFVDIIVKWTIITIFLSIIPAIFDYHQGIFGTLWQCINLTYGLFLFFVIKRYSLSTNFIIHSITFISVIWVFLELIQQITYPPNLWFSGRFGEMYDDIEQRMGIWRFYIWGVDYVMIAFVYWLSSIKKRNIIKQSIVFSSIFFIGLLCYGSRKHMFVTLLILILFAFGGGKTKKRKILILIFLLLFFGILYVYFYSDFIEMNDDITAKQGEGEDFIRFLSANYYLFDFSDSNLYPFFGAGLEVHGSELWEKLDEAQTMFGPMSGFWQADVGIIGYYSKFGLFGVSAILMYIWYFLKNWRIVDEWMKYFFIMKILLIIFDFWAIWDVGMTAYMFFLYLLDCKIRKLKCKTNENRHINIPLCS